MTIRLILFCSLIPFNVFGQKYSLDQSLVTFYSSAIIEDISAANKESSGLIDISTNQLAFIIPINKFKFRKKLMQEHFNEKYMESEIYPQATFQGTMIGFDSNSTDKQEVSAQGKLTIHGISQDVNLSGSIQSNANLSLSIFSTFTVKLEDYQIDIPQLLWQNIAEEIEVTIEFTFKPISK